MHLGIGEGEGRPPGHAQDGPALDPEKLAQTFDVGDEVSGGVRAEVVIRIVGERTAPPTAPLVIQDSPIEPRVEEATLAGSTT